MLNSKKLTNVSRSFSTFVLCSRHRWETHVVIGLVLGRCMRHAWLGFGLCLLPAIASSLLPTAATHGLGRGFLRRGGESSTHACRCGRFTGKRRATCRVRGKEWQWALANRILTCLPKRGNLIKIPQAAGFYFQLCHKLIFATSGKAFQLTCHCSVSCLKDSNSPWRLHRNWSSDSLGKHRESYMQLTGNHSCCVLRWQHQVDLCWNSISLCCTDVILSHRAVCFSTLLP